MEAAAAQELVAAHMRAEHGVAYEDLDISDVRGFWIGRGGKVYRFAEFAPDGTMPRDGDGKYLSPYRAWRALAADVTTLTREKMAFGCPTCGGSWDFMYRESVLHNGHRRLGARFARCVKAHVFRITR